MAGMRGSNNSASFKIKDKQKVLDMNLSNSVKGKCNNFKTKYNSTTAKFEGISKSTYTSKVVNIYTVIMYMYLELAKKSQSGSPDILIGMLKILIY